MLDVQLITRLDLADLKRVAHGYTSDGAYVVKYTDAAEHTAINIQFVPSTEPYVKRYDHFNDETLRRYEQALTAGYSFGTYDDRILVGLLIAEPHEWNGSIWVWEFHVAGTYRRMGMGRRLMECVAEKAKHNGFRTIVCETQNTNAPAIMAYRSLGFRIEGVDISYYSNVDYPDGEIAVFMKRRLQ